MGEDLPPDPYFAVLEDEFGETADHVRRETEEYISGTFKGNLPDDGCSGMLDPDLPGAVVPLQNVYDSFPRKAPDENIRHLTAIAMAMAKCNGSNRAVVNWVYSGRDDNLKSNSASGYAKSLPVYLVREDGDTPKMLMQKVREQVSFTASHSSAFNDSFFLKTPPANTMLYLYQKDIFVLGEIGKLVEEVQLPFNWTVPMEILSLTLIDTADKEGLERYFIYSPGYYSEEKARDFMKFLHEALEELDE
ncbi:MAG: hypothetical protein IKH16_07855, partial [Selenomonadaceae bacterium]|nr:hypothetical protein [Selenomonadaceae bacterium]